MQRQLDSLFRLSFARFLLVGVVNTAFGYGCYVLFLYFGLADWAALLVATILGIIFNFKTIGALVFRSASNRYLFPRFLAVYIVTYCVNLALIWGLKHFGLSSYAAGACALLPVALLAFILNKTFVFKNAPTA